MIPVGILGATNLNGKTFVTKARDAVVLSCISTQKSTVWAKRAKKWKTRISADCPQTLPDCLLPTVLVALYLDCGNAEGGYLMFTKELKEWKLESKCPHPILYKYDYKTKTLTIYTTLPGWLIGRAGLLYKKYKATIEQTAGHNVNIKFVETAYDVI